MCGIIGYTGNRPAVPVIVEGLQRLEYRGYDSSGVGFVQNGELHVIKAEGKLAGLEEKLARHPNTLAVSGIGHTRWATHGVPAERNAHPHMGGNDELAIVHNGIIENYQDLKASLLRKGYVFHSETDTEVMAHLIAEGMRQHDDPVEGFGWALRQAHGAYAVAMVTRKDPQCILAARMSAPLILGIGVGEHFVASDIPAFLPYTREVVFLQDGEIVRLTDTSWEVFSLDTLAPVSKPTHTIQWDMQSARKGGYKHFMLKEIFEQPRVITDCLASRIDEERGMVLLPELDDLPIPSRLRIIACGTSYHAGMWGQHLLEDWARMPVTPEIASEFRYRNVILEPGDMVLVISQSGETADTLAALRLAKEKGCTVIGLCNVVGASIPREADAVLYTQAGPEISVASTKAMCSQMVLMALMALYYGQRKDLLDAQTRHMAIRALQKLPKQLAEVLPNMRSMAQLLAQSYSTAKSFFYLGRGHAFPLALEGALKLKEISYIHAEGYASGEMKHGPIALVDPDFPTFTLAFDDGLLPKVKSNIVEVQARRGPVIALTNPGVELDVDHPWIIPSAWGPLAAFLALPAMQLFSYEMADYLGKDVDQPRNLAKSVTVE